MSDIDETSEDPQDIAIIGVAGRFPRADDVETFWRNIAQGRDCVSRFSDEEMEEAGVPRELREHPGYVPAKAIIEDADHFDAPFFGYSPTEARCIDPQQRLFLETAWTALEDAGYDPGRYEGLIGVYGGADATLYAAAQLVTGAQNMTSLLGNNRDYLTTRVAHKLDLKGPAYTVQTACSTSLVVVHVACQALLSWQCDMALAGGVGVSFPQRVGYLYQEGGVMSPDGTTRTFDARGRGTVGGDGCGIVLLKRLEDALEDGDTIRAVIRGSAINNDGADKVGFTAPSIDGQAEVIASALAVAGLTPDDITYLEAHGTATELGDPIEMAALDEVYKSGTDRRGFCAIGSVKSNMGHMNSASGIGGLIKTVKALQEKQLPPSLHFQEPNPQIDFAGSCFRVNTELQPWEPRDGQLRRAGVSSFGAGGTNAHAVLEEPPPIPPPPAHSDGGGPTLVAVSGRTSEALEAATASLLDHADAHPELSLADIGWTTLAGRRRFKHRRVSVVNDRAGLRDALEAKAPVVGLDTETPTLAFLFPGQEAQYPGMTRGLYKDEPAYREVVDQCAEILAPMLDTDIRQLMFEGDDRIHETVFTQPALFTVEYSLARLLMSWGLEPRAMLGHSIGEYVAACLAGVFTLEEALELVTERGRLVQEAERGSMLAVIRPEEEARRYAEGLDVAAVNGPEITILSGPDEAVEAAAARLAEDKVAHRLLHTSHAFHSAMLDPVLDKFRQLLGRFELKPPKLPYLSNLTGTWVTPEEATDPETWVQQLRRTVRASDCITELLKDPGTVCVEVGPGKTMTTLIRRHDRKAPVFATTRAANQEERPDQERLLGAMAGLWTAGIDPDWAAVHDGKTLRRVPLPTYPFQREKYLAEVKAGPGLSPVGQGPGRLPDTEWLRLPTWRRALPPPQAPARGAGPWLLFASDTPLAQAISERLEGRVYRVAPGDGYRRMGDNFMVNPRSPRDFAALVAEVFTEGPPRAAIHTWSTGPVSDFVTAQEVGPYSLLHLVQALGELPLRLGVVADRLFDVVGDEPLDVARAPLAACQVFGQERPGLEVRLVDAPADAGELADMVLADLEGQDQRVAYRGGAPGGAPPPPNRSEPRGARRRCAPGGCAWWPEVWAMWACPWPSTWPRLARRGWCSPDDPASWRGRSGTCGWRPTRHRIP